MLKRYAIVRGHAYVQHRGGIAYTGLSIYGHYDTQEEIRAVLDDIDDESSGLYLIVDLTTGQKAVFE